MIFKCPNCGESTYTERYSTSTLVYSPIEVIDGEYHFNDPNTHTTYCYCQKCRHYFHGSIYHGKITMVDEGEVPKEHAVDSTQLNITADSTIKTVPLEATHLAVATVKIDGTPMRTQYKWETDIENLQKEVQQLKEQVAELAGEIYANSLR